ncbi:MAG: outer membrane beta-barrel family protein, partial [Tannerellaceae bacterium]
MKIILFCAAWLLATAPLYAQVAQEETSDSTYSKTLELGEVVVKGERPLAKLVEGKITYDMPHLLSGKVVSNAYESLLLLPGVREQNGVLLLSGATEVTLLINGRPSSMPVANLIATLQALPYDRVQSAEIMYSTPPQYHIRGAAINIILKEGDAAKGLQGQANTAYTQKRYANYEAGVSILFATPKLSTDLNYSYQLHHDKTGMEQYSHHLYQGSIHDIEHISRGDLKANKQDIRLGLDYKLSDKDKLSLVYTTQVTTGVNNNERSNGTFSNSINQKREVQPIQLHNLLLSYSSAFGLTTGVEYTYYKDQTSQHFQESQTGKAEEFIADSWQKISRYRLYADQSHSFGSWTLNYGVQYLYATDQSAQTYHTLAGPDRSTSNMDSRLTEHTGNVYAGFEKSFGEKLSLSASLTGEYYKLSDFDEYTLFPSLEAIYTLSPSHLLMLSFSSDKVYPSYWELHGGIGHLNGYSELHGNPLLKPYREYTGQFTYMIKNKYILTAYYNYLKDYSAQLPYQVPDRLTLIYQSLNFDYKQTIGLNLTLPFRVGEVLDSRLTLNGFYDKAKSSHFHDLSFDKDMFVGYVRLDNTIPLFSNPNIKLEIAGAYMSKNIQGPAELSALWNIDAGIKWSFLHDRAELRLQG